jgi:hypothetical protein
MQATLNPEEMTHLLNQENQLLADENERLAAENVRLLIENKVLKNNLASSQAQSEERLQAARDICRMDPHVAAAAPALLAAGRASLDWLASYPGGCAAKVYDQMRAVIAKAEGR